MKATVAVFIPMAFRTPISYRPRRSGCRRQDSAPAGIGFRREEVFSRQTSCRRGFGFYAVCPWLTDGGMRWRGIEAASWCSRWDIVGSPFLPSNLDVRRD